MEEEKVIQSQTAENQSVIENEDEEPVETIFIYLALGGIRIEFTEVTND